MLFVIIGFIDVSHAQESSTKYRRSSLASMLLEHPEKMYSKEIKDVFLKIPVPDKFDNHNIGIRTFTMNKKQSLDKILNESYIPRIFVAKWFNYDSIAGFNMDLVFERGQYDATFYDVNLAEKTSRGTAHALNDAGRDLIGNTFLLVNDIKYLDKSTISAIVGAIFSIAGAGAAIGTGDTRFMQFANEVDTLVSSIKGFKVSCTSYLYRLEWNDSIAGIFENQYWNNPDAFWEDNKLFKLNYIGKQKVKSGNTSVMGIGEDKPEIMIRKVSERTIDKAIVKLQESYEEFRVRTPLYSTEPLQAKIGMKEGVSTKSKFEVLEQLEDTAGRISYKRVGVIKPVKNKIWDNRYMALEEKAKGADLNSTYFKKVSGSSFMPGMLIRECRKPVDYKENAFTFSLGLGNIANIGTSVDITTGWLHNFSTYWDYVPVIGWDIIKFRGYCSIRRTWVKPVVIDGDYVKKASIGGMQMMTGLRLQSHQFVNCTKVPVLNKIFKKKMSLYCAARWGIGKFSSTHFCNEWEAGININKIFQVGLVYNHQGGDYDAGYIYDPTYTYSFSAEYNININYIGLRLGFNL